MKMKMFFFEKVKNAKMNKQKTYAK